ncbi:MAG: zf-TFIIB domain-containing protein [Spirochaetia bacterium]|nr:zf-TFIIB domain-containing protein [Spirochaetia bacterium]
MAKIENCPVCKNNQKLKIIEKDGKKIIACQKCEGMYLHKGELNQMIPHYEGFFPTEDIEFSSIDHDPHKDNHDYIPCGYCENTHMIKVNFLSMSNIILDYCEKCGSIWVDGDEMDKIKKYWNKIENGSIESHDPINIQIINFLRSVSLNFFKWIVAFSLFFNAADISSSVGIEEIKDKAKGIFSSFMADVEYRSSSGINKKGKISYEYPDKLHIILADNSIIATNGKFLWIYNPETEICAKQEVAENSGGIFEFLKYYKGSYVEENSQYVYKNDKRDISEIIISVDNEMLKEINFKSEEITHTFKFNEIKIGTGIKKSLFNYKPPPNAQLVENPLNMYPELPIEYTKKELKKENIK